MLDDLKTTIQAALYERVSNPLVSTLFVSWIIWNLKFILVAFSSGEIDSKLYVLENEIYVIDLWGYIAPTNAPWLFHFVLPAFSTAIYLLLLPPLIEKAYGTWREHQSRLLNQKQEIEKKERLTAEQSQKIRSAVYEKEAELEVQLKRKDEKLSILVNENANLRAEAAEHAKQIQEASSYNAKRRSLEDKINRMKTEYERLAARNLELESWKSKHQEVFDESNLDTDSLLKDLKLKAISNQENVDIKRNIIRKIESRSAEDDSDFENEIAKKYLVDWLKAGYITLDKEYPDERYYRFTKSGIAALLND